MSIGFNARPLPLDEVSTNNSTSKLFEGSKIAVHLVLEGSQNSIDAANANGLGRARMRFRFGKVHVSDLAPYGFDQAMMHARACTDHDIDGDPRGEWLDVLTFEDWSGGLPGGPFDRTTPLGRFMFSIGTGVDGKSGRDNGRHGLGASTGALSSRHRLMYFHSVRLDGSAVASARLSLSSRTIDGKQYAPEIRLGHIDDAGNMTRLLEGDEAHALGAVFGFDRSGGEAGLCCAVVDPKEEVTFHALVASILGYLFYQVDTGRIEFEVVDDVTGKYAFISKETIDDYIGSESFREVMEGVRGKGSRNGLQMILEDLRDLLAFVRSFPGRGALPVIDVEDAGQVSPEARGAWSAGRATGRVLKVYAERSDGSREDGLLASWIRPALPGRMGYDILVRDSIVVIERRSGRLSLTVSEGDGVTRMIGDSEDPAHMRFLPDEARNRGWKVTSAIGHFKRAGERFADALSSSPDDVDKDMMSARFSLPGSDRASKVPAGVQDDTSEAEGAVALEEREGSSDVLKFRHNPKANTLTGRLSPAAREAVEAGLLTDIEVTGEYVGSLKGAGSFGNQDSRFSVDGCLDFATDGATVSISGVTQDLKVVFRDIDPNRDFKVVAKIIDPQLEHAA